MFSACFTSTGIHEPLAAHTLDRGGHAVSVRDVSVVPAEGELIAVAVKMLLAQLVIDPVVQERIRGRARYAMELEK